ncbi:hypothetical protein AG0111_0g304 [Alternaria gaisen]|uniref:Uncharacterized protein n=1 Tax=Alternaria gaisen TaxID=167740 RepID=A0ACB6G0T1_9PLEO|nr:hypothetical protein AG0111_0g304 [Alternaria gaisen]
MPQDWEASTDLGIFNDWFALDNTEELPPRYDEGFIPDLDESWLSAFMASEILPDPNNSSLRQFNADIASFDNNAGCKAGVDLDTPTLDEPADLRGPSSNHSDCLLDLLNYGVPDRVDMVAKDEEEAEIQSTHQPFPSPAGKSLSDPSDESHLIRSGQQASTKRLISDKPKFKRTKISNEVRTVLDAHFNGSAYPTDGELALLSGKTGLPVSVIKRWFMNARSRKTMPEGKRVHDPVTKFSIRARCHLIFTARVSEGC